MEKMALIVQNIVNNNPLRRTTNWSPIHMMSKSGNIELYKYVTEITKDKNPLTKEKFAMFFSKKGISRKLEYLNIHSKANQQKLVLAKICFRD